jgi:hypothetical protein
VNPASPQARKYAGFLKAKRDRVLARITGEQKLYDYGLTFNGFAAKLSAEQVATLRRTPGVASVTKDELRRADTITTPRFLGLTGPDGVWQKQFGGPAKAGDGVIVGVVDSGLWSENPSFAPLPASGTDAKVKRRFKGTCDEGVERPFFRCNNKVIGGRWFVKGLGAERLQPEEYLSPRDFGGHGSHTASTAAGNLDVPASVDGINLGKTSGMAPAARIAVYKVLWGDDGFGTTSDVVAAIDAAVSDGVDVINFSISGSTRSFFDPTEVAFYNAAKAGVFVSASAGNSGPGKSTVAHDSPWLTTVAAGTHDRSASKAVTLGDGTTYSGAGLGQGVPSSPLIKSTEAGQEGVPADQVRLCALNTLDPAKVTGKIVVCDRGVVARTEKSHEVKRAGGVGMVLANTSPNSLNADLHFVPTAHVNEVAGAAIKAYAATAGATASLAQSVDEVADAPKVIAFSSRGPALAGSGNLLKPDIMAPGVDVLAAVAPPSFNGRNFDFLSGTSMAAPHISGLAALVIGKHPTWSPMAVKSALMTTATTRDNRGNPITTDAGATATPLDYGSGQVVPAGAFDPGLVYESSARDWDRFACNYGPATPAHRSCARVRHLDPSDLNYPSIAVGSLAGPQVVTRTVTNVTSRRATYAASVTAPAGVDVTVTPSRLTIGPGDSKTYKVTINRASAPYGAYTFGAITWSDGRHSVRSPVAVRPVAIAAPETAGGTGASGSDTIKVTPDYTGTLSAKVVGLVPATVNAMDLVPEPDRFDPADPKESGRAKKVTVTVAPGTSFARFTTFDADHAPGTELAMFVFKAGTADLVAESDDGAADEAVTLTDPEAGQYDVYLDMFSSDPVQAKLNTFLVGDGATGNATVTPASRQVTRGKAVRATVAWTGLEAGRRWLGWVGLSDGLGNTGVTLVSVLS